MRCPITIVAASETDREAIYRVRHEVFARELGQHEVNPQGRLTDKFDAFNHYLVARRRGELAGFVSVTPPGHGAYAIDWIESRGGTRIVAIGRREVLGLYRKVGLQRLGREVRAGAVRFELMTGDVRELSEHLAHNTRFLRIVGRWADLRLGEAGAELPADV